MTREFNKPRVCIGCGEWTTEGVLLDTADLGDNRCICPNCGGRKNLDKANKNANDVLTIFFEVHPERLPKVHGEKDKKTKQYKPVKLSTSEHIYTALRAKFHKKRHSGVPVAMGASHQDKNSPVWTVSLSLAYADVTRADPRRPLHGLEDWGFTFTRASGYRVGKGNMKTTDETLDEACDLWAKGATYPDLKK